MTRRPAAVIGAITLTLVIALACQAPASSGSAATDGPAGSRPPAVTVTPGPGETNPLEPSPVEPGFESPAPSG
jgi:hypothetical protein